MNLISINRTGNRTVYSFLGIKFKLKNKDDHFLEDMLKKWETNYDSHEMESCLEKIVQSEIAENNKQIYLIYISTLIENHKEQEAEKYLEYYVKKYGINDLHEFPVVCFFARHKDYADQRIKQTAEIFEIFENNRTNNSLSKLLKNKSVAIVGNSPNLVGTNKGKQIDKHDFVIRFNNFKTQDFEADYGAKTNIWVCCQANDIINLSPQKISQLDYVLYTLDLWHTKLREKCYENICQNIHLDTPISYIGSEFKHELKDYGIVYPSSGLQGIYHLMHLTDIKRDNIFGFSFLDNNPNFYDHYFDKRSQHKKNKLIRNNHHHFSDEASLLNNLFPEEQHG